MDVDPDPTANGRAFPNIIVACRILEIVDV